MMHNICQSLQETALIGNNAGLAGISPSAAHRLVEVTTLLKSGVAF